MMEMWIFFDEVPDLSPWLRDAFQQRRTSDFHIRNVEDPELDSVCGSSTKSGSDNEDSKLDTYLWRALTGKLCLAPSIHGPKGSHLDRS
jgi:hypothetical protein